MLQILKFFNAGNLTTLSVQPEKHQNSYRSTPITRFFSKKWKNR
jgi:hypothetical protein